MATIKGLTPVADPPMWVKIIDQERCIGCHACSVACKAENDVPLGVHRTFVKEVESGRFPDVARTFQVTRCNQCEDAPCTSVCPTRAMYRRPDGIVDFDRAICIGCKACLNACPYDAIYIDPVSQSAEKCNFCAHRIDRGLEPACVSICPTEAIIVGDRRRPSAALSPYLRDRDLRVRKPERGTHPKLFYSGGNGRGLDPLITDANRPRTATERPIGDHHHASRGNDGRRRCARGALGLADLRLHLDESGGCRPVPVVAVLGARHGNRASRVDTHPCKRSPPQD